MRRRRGRIHLEHELVDTLDEGRRIIELAALGEQRLVEQDAHPVIEVLVLARKPHKLSARERKQLMGLLQRIKATLVSGEGDTPSPTTRKRVVVGRANGRAAT